MNHQEIQKHLDSSENISGIFAGDLRSSFVPHHLGESPHELLIGGDCYLVITNSRLLFMRFGEHGGGLFGEPYRTYDCYSTPIGNINAFCIFAGTKAKTSTVEFFLPSGLRCYFMVEASAIDKLEKLLTQATIKLKSSGPTDDAGALVAIEQEEIKRREEQNR